MNKLLIMSAIIFNTYAFAANNGTVSGYIKNITIKENGYLLIRFETPHSNPTECLQKDTVVIEPNSIVFKEIFSIALAAHASHKKTTFYTVLPCYEKYGTTYSVGITGAILDY